jgi:hypothetical protein
MTVPLPSAAYRWGGCHLNPIILRSIERMLPVLIGGVLIYSGFRLFLGMPERTESEGEVLLPGGDCDLPGPDRP